MAAAVEVIRGLESAAALLDPTRLQMLNLLAEADSASGLARRLKQPRQRVNYHLRELEKQGLVELVEERRKGNCIERVVRATARRYLISPEVLGKLGADPAEARDNFSASYLVAVAARAIREIAVLRIRAERAKQRLATLTVQAEVRFATAADRRAFAEELATAIARLVVKYHRAETEGGRLHRFFTAVYPAVTRREEDGAGPARME